MDTIFLKLFPLLIALNVWVSAFDCLAFLFPLVGLMELELARAFLCCESFFPLLLPLTRPVTATILTNTKTFSMTLHTWNAHAPKEKEKKTHTRFYDPSPHSRPTHLGDLLTTDDMYDLKHINQIQREISALYSTFQTFSGSCPRATYSVFACWEWMDGEGGFPFWRWTVKKG